MLLVPTFARAQGAPRVTVEYAEAPLSQVVASFASVSGRGIRITPGIGDPVVTASLTNVPWDAGLDRILAGQALIARADTDGGLRIDRQRRITVEYQSARLSDVVRSVSALAGTPIVVAPDVGDPEVSASLTDVDWERGLDQLLADAGLIAQREVTGGLRIRARSAR